MNIIQADAAKIKKYINNDGSGIANIKPASTWTDDVVEMVCNPQTSLAGIPIHYRNFEERLRFRDGEVTIWSGYNGHGKSLILNQFILAACYETKCLIISPEMPVAKTMLRMTHQATRRRHATESEVRGFHKWTDDRLWLYDQQGTVNTQMVYAVVRYAVHEIGIKHIVIDSLMKCGMGMDDYNAQKAFVDQLTTIAKDLGCHIHLVAHSRKGQNEKGIPDKHDIKGCSEITDMVDNVLIMFRNKDKEDAMERAQREKNQHDINELKKKYDGKLFCRKQRHGDWEGTIGLFFDLPSQLFMDSQVEPSKTDFSVNLGA